MLTLSRIPRRAAWLVLLVSACSSADRARPITSAVVGGSGWFTIGARAPTWGPGQWPTGRTCQQLAIPGVPCASLDTVVVGVPRRDRAGRSAAAPFLTIGGYADAMWSDDPIDQTQLFDDRSTLDPSRTAWTIDASVVDPPPYRCSANRDSCGPALQASVYLPNAQQVLFLGGRFGHNGATANGTSLTGVYLFNPYAPAGRGVSRPGARIAGEHQWTELDAALPYPETFIHVDLPVWTCGFDASKANPAYPAGAGIDCVLIVGGVEGGAILPGRGFHLGGTSLGFIMSFDPVTGVNAFTRIDQVGTHIAYFDAQDGWYDVEESHLSSGAGWGVIDSAIVELTPACHETAPAAILASCQRSPPASHLDGAAEKPSWRPEFVTITGRALVPLITATAGVNTAQILHVMATGTPFTTPGAEGTDRLGWEVIEDASGAPLRMPTICANESDSGNRPCGSGLVAAANVNSPASSSGGWAEDDFHWRITAPSFRPQGGYVKGADFPIMARGEQVQASTTSSAQSRNLNGDANNPLQDVAQRRYITPGSGGRLGALVAGVQTGRIFIAGGLAQLIDYAYPDSMNFGARRSALLLRMTSATRPQGELVMNPAQLIDYNGFGKLVPLPGATPTVKKFLVFGGLNRELTATSKVYLLTCVSGSCVETADAGPDLDSFPTTSYQTFEQGYTSAPCSEATQCNSGICQAGVCVARNAHEYPYGALAATVPGDGTILYLDGYDNEFAMAHGTYIEGSNTMQFGDVPYPGGYLYVPYAPGAPVATASTPAPHPGVIAGIVFRHNQAQLRRMLVEEGLLLRAAPGGQELFVRR